MTTSNLAWLDSFGRSEEQDKEFFAGSNLSAVKPQKKEPGLFDGTLDALGYMVPNAFFQTMGGVQELSAYKLSQMYELDLDNNEDALSEPIKTDKDKIIQRAENEAKYYRLKAKNDWTPNPETTGAAAQMIHAMGSTILKAAGYSVIAGGNPYFGGAMFGADIGLNEYGTLRDKGVDAKTARQAGWASGALNALGLAIPGSIGTSYLKSAALGAIVNPASDIAEQASIKFILENADYEKIAGEYDPFNPANLAVSSGVGIAFGLMGAKGARSRAIRAENFVQQDAEEAQRRAQENPAQPEGEGEDKPVVNSRLNQEVLNSIQNRDRSSQESVIQMRKIAEKPDFNLISESRVLENGSPVIAFVENPNPKTIGKEVIVSASDGRRMTMRYAVVEADSILTSNDVEGFKNPDFANPNVLGPRAIAGNGRVAGVKSAYQHGTAGDYRAELMDQSKQFGISRRKIKNMRQPILVRIMKDEDVKTDTGELSNRSGIQKLNPVEQAAQDARNVNVEDLEFNADGTFSQKSIQGFVHANPDKEGMLDPRGNIIADNATQRMRTAVFSAAYGDNSLVSRFIANSDKDRKIFTALLNVAPDLVRLRKLGGNFDFSNSLVEAVADVFETRKETKGLQRGKNTMPLYGSSPEQEFFKQVLLSKNPEKIKDIVRRMNEIASDESQASMFGEVKREDVFNTVKQEFSDLDLTPDLEAIALRKGVDEQITSSQVDAAMEARLSNVMTKDQPSGPNGNINKSLQDEATAREQIDDGKKVEVSGEGVDPEVMDKHVSSFITRFVKELVGAGADKKVAEMNARVIDAFFSTMGVRLGKSSKEIEAEYELKVRNGEEPSKNSYAQEEEAPQVRPEAVSKSDKLHVAPAPKFETIVVGTDKDGKNHRVLGVNGDPNLTIIPEGIKGVKPLPVRLQETTLNGIHIRKHEAQLKKALGYESVEQAIWDVSQNWRWVFKGSKENCIRLIRPFEIAKNGNLKKTVLQIELQEVAGVYRVGSIFYSDKKIKEEDILFDRQPYDHGPLSQYETAIGLNSAPTSLKTGQSSSLPSILNQKKNSERDLYQNGRKGIYTPGERVITLLQSADESTFVHESGHYFLDVLTDIGSRERVPKQIKDDIQTLMDWFGVKDLEEWNSLSFEEKRQYHEKFARGFEQYLREGKAPSSTLEKVFKSFKDWLIKIYKSAEELDVELSPEVREVYDRLLATDEQIKKRKAELEGRAEADTSTGQLGIEVPAQVTETINNLPIPDEAKGVIKDTLGIREPEKIGDQHPHYGIPTAEEFLNQRLESGLEKDPNATLIDDDGDMVSLESYLIDQSRLAEDEFNLANGMGEAAQCMWSQGAFDDI